MLDTVEALRFDPRALEETEERLFAIRALARKHNVLADDLAALHADMEGRLAALDASEGDLGRLKAAVTAADAAFAAAARTLSEARHGAASPPPSRPSCRPSRWSGHASWWR